MNSATLRFALDTAISLHTKPHQTTPRETVSVPIHDYDPWEPVELSLEDWPYDPGPKQYLIEFENGNVDGPWQLDAMRQIEGVRAVWEWKYEGGTEERIPDQPLTELLQGDTNARDD